MKRMRKRIRVIPGICLFLLLTRTICAQNGAEISGQISTYANYNANNILYIGGRYIPQFNISIPINEDKITDFEISANLYQTGKIMKFDSASTTGKIKPYRIWGRYSTEQFEIRVGLQKINFGSANMLRPLMWFDKTDPTDPLQLTDGVPAILGRYYFLNNANIWLWGVYPTETRKTWETEKTKKNSPEFGGRIQYPIPKGEIGGAYHRRTIERGENDITENRAGIDWRGDFEIGVWFEGAGFFRSGGGEETLNQYLGTLGGDYTFDIGNGLNLVVEHMIYTNEIKEITNPRGSFTAISVSYPLNILDNLSGIFYYDMKNKQGYYVVNYQRRYDEIIIHVTGYASPETYLLPQRETGEVLFAGRGIQITFIYNY